MHALLSPQTHAPRCFSALLPLPLLPVLGPTSSGTEHGSPPPPRLTSLPFHPSALHCHYDPRTDTHAPCNVHTHTTLHSPAGWLLALQPLFTKWREEGMVEVTGQSYLESGAGYLNR